ncbi:MAG: AGE family epimerase/isomerase, partial [Puniceicoccales bacterium]
YVDGFAIYGLTEWYLATRDPDLLPPLQRTTDHVIHQLSRPHEEIPHFPYPIPAGSRAHGLPMIFSHCLGLLGHHLQDDRYIRSSQALSESIWSDFYRPSRDLIIERIGTDGKELPPPGGTAVVPGHVIEDLWFQIELDKLSGKTDRSGKRCDLIRRHLEEGWDPEYGGIFLAIDADQQAAVDWGFADYKLWWPHTEALYALLAAYEITGESWCLEWYQRVFSYSMTHFFSQGHGEWIQRLTREGSPTDTVVALPVKDPFHLPRSILLQIELLERLQSRNPR